MLRTVTIAAIFAVSIASAQAGPSTRTDISAEPAGGALSADVRFGDLDLSQPADARLLIKRLRQAAKIVCTPGDILQYSNCVDQTAGKAFDQAQANQAGAGSVAKLVRR